MNARNYYAQFRSKVSYSFAEPHIEDSGPVGRPCFRRGTLRENPSIVCAYPGVSGELDFWAVADTDGAIYVGEDVDANMPAFVGTPYTLPVYAAMRATREPMWDDASSGHRDWLDLLDYRAYPPRVRCSRLAFVGGLGYEAGYITLPDEEHPGDNPPTPSADSFLGWYGFDTSNRQGGLIDPATKEGWGRPAFEFAPLATRADQSWAYAPASPSRDYDVAPERGTTTISAGAWEYTTRHTTHNAGRPADDIDIDNWWLLALIGGDPRHGSSGKAKKLYWNPTAPKTLSFFGEDDPGLTEDLFRTILRRIYAAHCKTPDIDPDFVGIPFPPGFLVDVRILAETWECKCTQALADAAGITTNDFPHTDADHKLGPTILVYLGTHFSVLYRCPFPLWRRVA